MLNILSQDIYPISSFGIYPECTKKDKNKLYQDSSSTNISKFNIGTPPQMFNFLSPDIVKIYPDSGYSTCLVVAVPFLGNIYGLLNRMCKNNVLCQDIAYSKNKMNTIYFTGYKTYRYCEICARMDVISVFIQKICNFIESIIYYCNDKSTLTHILCSSGT